MDPAGTARLVALLPDVPRYVEARWMLLEGRCEVFGPEEDATGPDLVALSEEEGLVCVLGRPGRGVVAEALARVGDTDAVIALPENVALVAEALPGREAQPAVLHLLGEGKRLPGAPEGEVRLLSGSEELRLLPSGLRSELRAELERVLRRGTPAIAAFVGDVPVSFCYVASETEGLWDISIDTLDGYRRRGYAARCAAAMIRHMRDTTGKEPVWGALETNAASMGLAARLGFVPVDRVFVFEPVRGG